MADGITKKRLSNFKETLFEWTESCEQTVKEINALADNLDEHFGRISKAKIGGSTAGIVGGVMAAVGFGLSFVTFGASLGLTIAGGVIAGVGGATLGGSVATDAILSRNRKKAAEEIIKKYNEKMKAWKMECLEIGNKLKEKAEQSDCSSSIEQTFPHWIKFWVTLVLGTGQAAKSTGWDIIAKSILTSLRIATAFDDVALNGARIGGGLVKALGPAARGLHIAGGIVGILLIPLDVYTLVDSAIDVHKKNPHKVSSAIRGIGQKIQEECPTKTEIETMIRETSDRL
ncbi:unnamed protein product [Mytilus coruscus]|uniref:Uncharacterized protein n=1 Tax=Mytilus coruscus TaxID=42192 RepID=A0A6J8A2Y5_MYTCO|nr:unnamed protein product [Mytilus coruscus]